MKYIFRVSNSDVDLSILVWKKLILHPKELEERLLRLLYLKPSTFKASWETVMIFLFLLSFGSLVFAILFVVRLLVLIIFHLSEYRAAISNIPGRYFRRAKGSAQNALHNLKIYGDRQGEEMPLHPMCILSV